MGWRFRRSFKIAPGVRFNVSKSGVSWSLGGRGATVNLSKRGVRQTIDMPGTGLSFTQQLGGGSSNAASATAGVPAGTPARYTPSSDDYARLGVPRSKRVWWWLAAAAFAVFSVVWPILLFGVAIAVIGALLSVSRAELFARELARRQQQFMEAGKDAADDRQSIERLLAIQNELKLTDEEIGADVVDTLHGMIELFDLEETALTNGGRLPALPGYENIVAPDTCLFTAPAFLDKRGPDENGDVYVTSGQIVFVGSTLTAIPLNKVALVTREGRTVTVQRRDRQTPFRFLFESAGAALKTEYVAKNVIANVTAGER